VLTLLDFEVYLREVCLKLGFLESIEEFRDVVQYYWDSNLSTRAAVYFMRERLGIERVH
jgi:hypothetical protein